MEKTKEIVEKQQEQVAEGTRSGPYFEPLVDIFETEEALTIQADMPGISEKDVEIDLREGILTIGGNMPQLETIGQEVLREFQIGNYLRRFTLTETIDQEHISASMKDGVLRVDLPKLPKLRPRKIQVKAS